MENEQWVEVGAPVQRHRRIGGSELGILLGMGSYGGKPFDVWNRIVNGISTFVGNAYSDRGTKYEPVVRDLFQKTTGAEILPHPGMILFEDCFAASLDDMVLMPGSTQPIPVDYKTASNSKANLKKWGADGSDQFPAQYRAQLVLYMAVTGAPRSQLFTAFGTDEKDAAGKLTGVFTITEHRRYYLERDLDFENQALEAGRKFWREHVLTKIAPTVKSTGTPQENPTLKLSPAEQSIFDSFVTSAVVETRHPVDGPGWQPVLCTVCGFDMLPGEKRPAGHSVSPELCANKHAHAAPASVVAAPVLPPDAPVSNPELAAECLHCPPAKTGKPVQHLLADCPTLNAPPVEEKKRKPRKLKIEEAESDLQSVPVPGPVPVPTIVLQPDAVIAHEPTLRLYVNAEPFGIQTSRLEPYIAALAAGLARANGADDIRASDAKLLGFGKWKGALAAAARLNPPRGVYTVSTAESELAQVVVEALIPLCALGFPVRGTR